MPSPEPIVLASGNPKKLREMREIMGAIGVEILSLDDLGVPLTEPEETGTTFEENARIKAVSYAEQTGRLCLADDSGLEVDALGGEPGVYSARYSVDLDPRDLAREERDRLNNEKLMRGLGDRPLSERRARFVCAMCLAGPRRDTSGGGGVSPPIKPRLITTQTGNLPHWRLDGSTYFVTFRTQSGTLSPQERQIVLDACVHIHHTAQANVHITTVMPDHVHMLLTPYEGCKLSSILHSIKSFSAHQINAQRQCTGKVWQRESYDRIVRSPDEAQEKYNYIESNAVRKGLVDQPGDYQWTVRGHSDGRRDAAPTKVLEASATTDQNPITVLAETRGKFEGTIGLPGDVPRGVNGFGYDPLFLVAPGHERTSAELEPDEKHALSHRGEASRLMAEKITSLGLASEPRTRSPSEDR